MMVTICLTDLKPFFNAFSHKPLESALISFMRMSDGNLKGGKDFLEFLRSEVKVFDEKKVLKIIDTFETTIKNKVFDQVNPGELRSLKFLKYESLDHGKIIATFEVEKW